MVLGTKSITIITIPGICKLLRKADEVILTEFIPAITGGITITENERKLLPLGPQLGALGIPTFEEKGELEYQNSIMISGHNCNRVTDQFRRHEPDSDINIKKKQIKSMKNDRQKRFSKLQKMKWAQKKENKMICLETAVSSWLTTLSIKEEGYVLNKQQFWDTLLIRYDRRLKRIPSHCACGNTFNLQHALQFPSGGFVTLRHNHIRNTTANLLTEVWKNVCVEPQLQPLSGETFSEKTANISDQAWVDISARGFWLTGQVEFFVVKGFQLNHETIC